MSFDAVSVPGAIFSTNSLNCLAALTLQKATNARLPSSGRVVLSNEHTLSPACSCWFRKIPISIIPQTEIQHGCSIFLDVPLGRFTAQELPLSVLARVSVPEVCRPPVVIPTCDPEDPAFSRCVESVVRASPAAIHIVAVGKEQEKQVLSTISPCISRFPSICFRVSSSVQAHKRHQITAALPAVSTSITVLCDDHVIWPSANILRAAVAPFEADERVGGVGTNKRVIRHADKGPWAGFWNVMGALYLERHNFEHTSSNAVDGGVAVISGRTCLYRTCILQDPALLAGYLDERFLWGLCGPLNADDDNFLTRALVRRGFKIKFQNTPEAMILCDVGEYPKFLQQCLRWARTTFRSNTCSLVTDRAVYQAQPWAVYSLQISLMVNFALFYDAALVWTLTRTDLYTATTVKALVLWILVSKLPKLLPYFLRHPADLVYLPGYYVFAYCHSLIKLWALLTFWDTRWSGRNLDGINLTAAAAGADSGGEGEGEGRGGRKDPGPDASPAMRAEDFSLHNTVGPPASQYRVKTPWGSVQSRNLHQLPANILQTQLSSSTKRSLARTTRQHWHGNHMEAGVILPDAFDAGPGLETVTPPQNSSVPPPPRTISSSSRKADDTYSRSWSRRGECGKLHEGYHLRRGCVLGP
ncbi:hypothetical protein CLAIMM_14471 isoform 1 [Cladophialophora immunda]|nr:hypothetical protein CLAIMM_14471 isoform 1 [Cladophialophora immunda]